MPQFLQILYSEGGVPLVWGRCFRFSVFVWRNYDRLFSLKIIFFSPPSRLVSLSFCKWRKPGVVQSALSPVWGGGVVVLWLVVWDTTILITEEPPHLLVTALTLFLINLIIKNPSKRSVILGRIVTDFFGEVLVNSLGLGEGNAARFLGVASRGLPLNASRLYFIVLSNPLVTCMSLDFFFLINTS